VGLSFAPARAGSITERVRDTVALLRRRGYGVSPSRLGELCLGGRVSEEKIRWAVAASTDLVISDGLVVDREERRHTGPMLDRARAHGVESGAYLAMSVGFVRRLVAFAPFIRGVAIAGSLASGGFRASDDVDLNLLVDDGYRHLTYVAVNALGLAHAMRHRDKPVDDLTRRPIAPRLMTANLILERSQWRPLVRQDADMAFELLVAEPVFGLDAIREVVEENPALLEHFPQLADRPADLLTHPPKRISRVFFPRWMDRPSRALGRAAWGYMQWTRRHRPEALARVAFVRSTMRPYTLFEKT